MSSQCTYVARVNFPYFWYRTFVSKDLLLSLILFMHILYIAQRMRRKKDTKWCRYRRSKVFHSKSIIFDKTLDVFLSTQHFSSWREIQN